ncbi:hypothetical protein ABK040_008629 [Willaertia magna]
MFFQNHALVKGKNVNYQLGLGDNVDRMDFTLLDTSSFLNNNEYIQSISGSSVSTIILTNQHHIYVCGNNEFGQLGIGETKSIVKEITKLNFFETELHKDKIIQISCGTKHCLFLTKLGKVYVTGSSDEGQLGLSFRDSIYIPIICNFLQNYNIKLIKAIGKRSFFLTNLNKLFCCGENHYGQLGINSIGSKFQLNQIIDLPFKERIIQIEGGISHTMILTNFNKVYSFGLSSFCGCLQKPSTEIQSSPKLIPYFTKNNILIESITCSNYTSFFITKNLDIYVCGLNDLNQLGILQEIQEQHYILTPTRLNTFNNQLNNKFKISASANFTYFLNEKTSDIYQCGSHFGKEIDLLKIPQLINDNNSVNNSYLLKGKEWNIFCVGFCVFFIKREESKEMKRFFNCLKEKIVNNYNNSDILIIINN